MKLLRKASCVILALLVMLSCFFGITAMAGTKAADREPADAPRIVSKNIGYSSYLHIYFAIPKDTVAAGSTLTVDFYDSDPREGVKPSYTVTKAEIQTISAITGNSEDYYVVNSRGIAPKSATSTVYAVPVATDANGVRAEGEAISYSVAEYCFERLTFDGYINVPDDGSIDSQRRELYMALLSYCHYEQIALVDDYTNIPKLSELTYMAVNGGSADGFKRGFIERDKIYTVTKYDDMPEEYTFLGWNITSFNVMGELTFAESDCDAYAAKLTDGGALLVSANYRRTQETIRAEEIAAQEKLDDEEKARQWAALEAAFVSKKSYSAENARDLTDALKTLYTLYGKEMVIWVASLYAKGFNDIENGRWAGGFYASTAGRDTAGYGPDLQCTVQLLRFLQQSGVIDSIGRDIPLWMQQQMIYFAKSLQDPNGYYYHPQWGKEFTDTKISRRGRDLGWGNSLLSYFGESPVYNTSNGAKGDGETADEYLEKIGLNKDGSPISKTSLSASLGISNVTAVSKVILASDSTDESTAYLKSHTAFINYLLTDIAYGMRTSAYGTGNTLNATSSQIGNYSNLLGVYTYKSGDEATTNGASANDYRRFDGMTMKEMLLKVLDDAVNPNTGLFGGYDSATETFKGMESITFADTNGFFKVITIYNSWGHAYPNAPLAALGLISNLTNADLPSTGNACDVYNVWNAIGSLKSNSAAKSGTVFAIKSDDGIKMCDADTPGAVSVSVVDFINKTLELRGAEAVRITFDKIKGYKKVDGGFSHSYTAGVSNHQGCPVSPSGANVSDVDATCIASTGLVRSIFTAFGMDSYKPDFFGKSDYMKFIDYIEAAGPVYKSTIENITDSFDGENRQNKITGDTEIIDGKLVITGGAEIERSGYSTIGSAATFACKLLFKSGSYTLTFLTEDGVAVAFDITADGSLLKLTNSKTGSYARIADDGASVTISIEIKIHEGNTLICIFHNSVQIYEEKMYTGAGYANISKPTDVKSASIVGPSVTVDDLAFGVVSPTYSANIINSNGRLDFEWMPVGEWNAQSYSDYITFVNQTSDDARSRALIISEGKNKFLRLEDNYDGSVTAQNYFNFKRQALPCETVVFESKMRISANSSGIIPISVLNGSGKAAYYGRLRISGGYLYAGVYHEKSSNASTMVKTDVKAGEWFTVRLEYTAADEYDDSFLCEIFINGVSMGSSTAKNSGTTVYCSASDVSIFRMACDTSWSGTIDYDNIYVGSKKNYTPPTDSDNGTAAHYHIPRAETAENFIDYTCTESGSYERVFYCEDGSCGFELGRVYVYLPAAHREGEAVIENCVDSSCYTDGSYEEVIYCTACGEELSRTTYAVAAHHTEKQREQQISDASCSSYGEYYRITYCSVCGRELERQRLTTPMLPHNIVNGTCAGCGGTDFILDGVIDFEDINETILVAEGKSGNKNTGSASTIGTTVYTSVPSAGVATSSIVSDGDNKYVVLERLTNNTSTNTWIDIFRDTSREADMIYFEGRINLEATTVGSGLYVRLYTGRSPSAGGTRIIYHTVSIFDDYISYAGSKTHLKYGEWGTIRITFEKQADNSFLYTFLVKNETGSAITSNGVSYADGDFIPYYTTTDLVSGASLDNVNDICAITFMQSTNSLSALYLDDIYFGGAPSYVSLDKD